VKNDGNSVFWAMLCIVMFGLGLIGGCQTIETAKPTFDYGQAFLPSVATKSGQEVSYRGVVSDRSFIGELSSDGYREFTGSWVEAAGARIKPGTRWPLVVFLHGCSGYAFYTAQVADYYLEAGAIVVAPDSMKRSGRVAMCNSGNMAYRTNMRKQEARYAVDQLVKQSWVDAARIVLVGQSEGGNAVAAYSGDEFAAYIITGVSCRHNGGAVSAPTEKPVLAIKGADDRTYPDGQCSVRRTIGGSQSIVIPGYGHMVLTSGEAKTAIYAFLQECCNIESERGDIPQ